MRTPLRVCYALALLSLAVAPAAAQLPSQVAADEKLLRSAGVTPDAAGLLALLRRYVPTKEDEQRVAALLRQLTDKSFKVREQAGTGLVAVGPPALPTLRRIAREGDLETQRRAQRCVEAIERASSPQLFAAAARLLKLRRPDGACAVLLDYLPLAVDESVAEEVLASVYALGVKMGKVDVALDALFGLGGRGPVDESVLAALKAPDPVKCAAAALVVGSFGTPDQRRAVRRLLDDDHAVVRLRAAQGLVCARDPAGVPALIALLGKGSLPLAQQAEDLLARVAGANAPAVPLGEDEAARAKSRQAWEAWWRANADKIDLARADLRSPFAGQNARARAVTRRFLNALGNADVPAILALVDVPFAVDAVAVFRMRAEVEMIFRQAALNAQKYTFAIRDVVRMDEYLRRTKRPPEEFLKQVPREGLRAVYVDGEQNGKRESAAILIRFRGGQAHVVGLADARSDRMGK